MKLTTPLKIFLSVALLAGGAQAASLSLGVGGLGQGHSTTNPAGTLVYTDPSGIVISYEGQPHANFRNGSGTNTRGWNNDPNPFINGFADVGGNHLGIAHFGNAASGTVEKININFSSASNVDLATVRLKVWDLDTGGGVTEELAITGNPTLVGAAGDLGGALSNDVALTIGASKIVSITPNQNPGTTAGLSAFTLEWTPVPEPTAGLLALLGSSLLFFRRRR